MAWVFVDASCDSYGEVAPGICGYFVNTVTHEVSYSDPGGVIPDVFRGEVTYKAAPPPVTPTPTAQVVEPGSGIAFDESSGWYFPDSGRYFSTYAEALAAYHSPLRGREAGRAYIESLHPEWLYVYDHINPSIYDRATGALLVQGTDPSPDSFMDKVFQTSIYVGGALITAGAAGAFAAPEAIVAVTPLETVSATLETAAIPESFISSGGALPLETAGAVTPFDAGALAESELAPISESFITPTVPASPAFPFDLPKLPSLKDAIQYGVKKLLTPTPPARRAAPLPHETTHATLTSELPASSASVRVSDIIVPAGIAIGLLFALLR